MAMKVTSYYHRTNPDEAGYSLGNFAEIWGACFEAAGVRSVVEVGAERGRLTQELLRWAGSAGAKVTAIEPDPISDLVELVDEHQELEVIEATSPRPWRGSRFPARSCSMVTTTTTRSATSCG